MNLTQVAERSGIPYGTVIDHKSKGLLCVSTYEGRPYISEQEYKDYLKRIANKDMEIANICGKMLLTLDETIGEIRVNKISDNDIEGFQIKLEPLIKDFLEKLDKIVREYAHKF